MTLAAGLMQSCQPACAPAPPAAVCTPPAGVPDSARQVVVVTASGFTADVDLLVHDGTAWQCAAMDMPGRVGSQRRPRPVGAALRRRHDAGRHLRARHDDGAERRRVPVLRQRGAAGRACAAAGTRCRPNDCWGATPSTPDYNLLVSRPDSACNNPDEYLPNLPSTYSQAALIDANMGPNRSGDEPGEPPLAAAIFLHRHTYDAAATPAPTSGCVSLNAENLARVLTRLVPGEAWFVIR